VPVNWATGWRDERERRTGERARHKHNGGTIPLQCGSVWNWGMRMPRSPLSLQIQVSSDMPPHCNYCARMFMQTYLFQSLSLTIGLSGRRLRAQLGSPNDTWGSKNHLGRAAEIRWITLHHPIKASPTAIRRLATKNLNRGGHKNEELLTL
jgi:hypothetical protein